MSLTKVSNSMITGAVINVLDYGADPTGVADSTAAIQAALDFAPVANSGRIVFLPAGTYKFSKLVIKHNNTILRGEGQLATYLASTAVDGSLIASNDQTVTLYYCGIEGMQISAPNVTSTANTKIVDWRSMQFGFIKDVWVLGNNTVGLSGIEMGVITYAAQECTYNLLDNIYIGLVGYGIKITGGANTNTFRNIRVQPGASAFGYHIAFGATEASNNVFLSCHCEFPGNTVTGYALGSISTNTVIIGARLEGLATGINIVSSKDTNITGCYFSSNTTNISSNAQNETLAGCFSELPNYISKSSISGTGEAPNYDVDYSFYGYGGQRSRFLNAAGGFRTAFNDSLGSITEGHYGSTYSGGTIFGVGANGTYYSKANGTLAIGTTSSHVVNFGTNGVRSQEIDTSGNFYPYTTNSVSCGKSGNLWTAIWATNGTIQTSDVNAKFDIAPSDLGLNFISKLNAVSYKMKVAENIVTPVKIGKDAENNSIYREEVTPRVGSRTHYGFIAQEVKAVLGDKDAGIWIKDKETGDEGLRYEELIGPMIKAIQELKAELDAYKASHP